MREGDEVEVRAVRIDDVLVGRYRLEQKIGEGGMGTVYLAHDKELDRKVAIKLLAATFARDKEVVERFEREARLTARLDHPNIVPVYDVGNLDGRPFMVMKKLEGESLAGLLRSKGGFGRDETIKLFRQLAAGVDFIHAQGFIHRDLKAGNIFVGTDGQATILDFGILRPQQVKESLTRTGMVMGTPHYMAPEQALGIKNVDHRVDLYALAVVIFECLTGTLPFEADSELRLIQMQAHSPPPDLVERAPWIPKPVAEVMARALSKVPDERYPSANALVDALEKAWVVTDAKALPTTVMRKASQVNESTAPSLRRSSGEGVAIIRPATDLAAGLGRQGLPPGQPAKPDTRPPDPSTSELQRAVGKSRAPVVVGLLALLAAAGGLYVAMGNQQGKTVATEPDAGVQVVVAPPEVVDAGEEPVLELDAGELGVAVLPLADAGEDDEPVVDAGTGVAVVQKARRGQLTVVTTHKGEPFWAQLSIDGVDKGRTPVKLWLEQGNYKVRVERPGLRSVTRQIWVASGKSSVVRIDLRQ